MITYVDLMPICHGCTFWKIACCIDNKLGLCSMCELEVRKQEKKNEEQQQNT